MQYSRHSRLKSIDGKIIFMGYLGGHIFTPFDGGILDLGTNSKQPVKAEPGI